MMKKQMKRTVYEAPVTERFSVELEGSLMAASVVTNETNSTVSTTAQESGGTFDMGGDDTDTDGFYVDWQ